MTASHLLEGRASAPAPAATPRRVRGRLSSGHLAMIAAALVAGLANFAVLARSAPTAVAGVATEPLVAGEPLEASMVRFVPLEVGEDVRTTLLDEEGLAAHTGWIMGAPVAEGELVTLGGLRPAAGAEGTRAMSVTLPLSRAADGTLRAGDRVDVITAGGGTATYVLTDVPVLAVRALGGGLGGTAELTATVAVDEEGALRLAAAVDGEGVHLVRATGAPVARVGDQVRLESPTAVAAPGAGATADAGEQPAVPGDVVELDGGEPDDG